ncbi:hypothetical protein ACG7TL_003569 [Trametes sanguinea]
MGRRRVWYFGSFVLSSFLCTKFNPSSPSQPETVPTDALRKPCGPSQPPCQHLTITQTSDPKFRLRHILSELQA